jgi:hypothetical protein
LNPAQSKAGQGGDGSLQWLWFEGVPGFEKPPASATHFGLG